MSWISILGMIAILGLAWAMSYHRRRFPFRTVAWGLGLQFLFALIILAQEPRWSFVGMGVLALLLVTYLLHDAEPPGGRWVAGVLAVAAGVGATWLLALLPAPSTGFAVALALLLVLLIASARLGFGSRLRPLVGVLFLVLGTGALIALGFDGRTIFAGLTAKVSAFLELSDYGAAFLFGNLVDDSLFFPGPGAGWPGFGFQFAFKVLPTIIFFGGFMAVLYYLGIMQVVIVAIARFMRWTVGTSGAETLSCSANIFVGQTEAPLLIKPFLDGMTRSELLTIMVGGFATIAGGVLAGYIAMGIPAGHLIAASVMSAPAALVLGKLIYPETEHSETAGDVDLPEIPAGDNVIEAASNGITDGLRLAVNVGAMLIGFIALIAVVDVLLQWADGWIDGAWLGGTYVEYGSGGGMSPVTGEFQGWFPGSLRTLFGTLLAPLAFLMGVPWAEAREVGNLLGIKLSLNEFVAFGTLGTYIQEGALGERATVIATYALTGFANFSSIGIQIGGISALAPDRKSELAKIGLKAMFGGALASWLTATVAGILL